VVITVAAVIPLYNGGEFIEEAIRSVAAQTDPVDEIIVVNDGSTDNGPEIVRSLLNSFPITFLQQPNAGQSAARNAAINHTSCTHVAFLDQRLIPLAQVRLYVVAAWRRIAPRFSSDCLA
jgi:glycosyltransferase involved in cell wall biosynthesis